MERGEIRIGRLAGQHDFLHVFTFVAQSVIFGGIGNGLTIGRTEPIDVPWTRFLFSRRR